MIWLILLLFLAGAVELVDSYIPAVFLKKSLAYLLVVVSFIDSVLILVARPAIWSALILYVTVFRIFNLARLIDGRKQIDYLRSTFIRTSLVLSVFQLIILGLTYIMSAFKVSFGVKWALLIILELIMVLMISLSLKRSFIKSRPKLSSDYIEDSKLPSLTVAIPARNETEDLDDCLRSLIASDYPKLEILVLDDCSQEKRTPEIIRQFAHDGVRFLAGKVPDDNWTAKNYAYQQLAEEAEGRIVLFCGVDTRFDRHTLRQMVELKSHRKKTMVSFMPHNDLPPDTFKRLLIQPLRYLWEMGLPRRFFERPPVLSTCWLIDRDRLIKWGAFKAISRNIVPERYFARQAVKSGDSYSFLTLGSELGLVSKKSFDDQLATAVRTRYPLLKQRPENVCYLSLLEAAIFILPVGMVLYELAVGNLLLMSLGLLNVLIIAISLFSITKLAYGRRLALSLVVFPLVFIYDIVLGVYSMWKYEFDVVIWKGRNVCLPVMQLVPELPHSSNSAQQS